jgi:low affinity Fe/Cu permease
LKGIVREKESLIQNVVRDMDEIEKKLNESERSNDALTIKSSGLEKQLDMQKKKLEEKVGSLTEILNAEKE